MAFRAVIIENPATLSVKREQLVIRTEGEHTLPVEDISAILLESRQSMVTAAALAKLGQAGCALFLCDEKHMPCAVLTPYMQHSRMTSVLHTQLSATLPLKKRLWQSIVVSKITNQAACLCLCGKREAAAHLEALAKRVRSGDPDNVEATAAQLYFPALFGKGFTRLQEDGYNAALNYGYAILRGCIARTLAVYGYIPAFGLHHDSQLNSFNLADDLIEPFRPVVDMLVVTQVDPDRELTPEVKRLLFNCMNLEVDSGGQLYSVDYAVQRLVQSLSRSLQAGTAELTLPHLTELRQHRYE